MSDVSIEKISAEASGQRLDNYLIRKLKNIPKSHIYKILRSGQVRVNGKRKKHHFKLALGDLVRIPPLKIAATTEAVIPKYLNNKILSAIIYEDDSICVLNKPPALAVHSGSKVDFGIIEALKSIKGYENCQLVHRLDRDTSGCLLIAKNRATLIKLHNLWQNGEVRKEYQGLVSGKWPAKSKIISNKLAKNRQFANERMTCVQNDYGKDAITEIKSVKYFRNCSLLTMQLKTGRTHQLRVHTSDAGYPLLGDIKYGLKTSNQYFRKLGLKRMFLHAKKLSFIHPATGKFFVCEAELDTDLASILNIVTKDV